MKERRNRLINSEKRLEWLANMSHKYVLLNWEYDCIHSVEVYNTLEEAIEDSGQGRVKYTSYRYDGTGKEVEAIQWDLSNHWVIFKAKFNA